MALATQLTGVGSANTVVPVWAIRSFEVSAMDVRKDLFIPMRDGVHLAMDVYRKDGSGRHPALLVRTPYLKETAIVTSQVGPFVEAGFVVVVSDTRGTGFSEGEYDYYNYAGGPFDGYDTVEWMASEPWCDGNVGIMGTSAMAILAYLTAITQPPHLKAMMADAHPADFYYDQWFQGGVFRYQNRITWALGMLPRMLPATPGSASDESFGRKRGVQLERFAQAYRNMSKGRGPIGADWLTDMYQRKTYGQFWRDLSIAKHHDKINIPTFHGGSWQEHFVRGTLTSHEAINVPKKLIVSMGGPPGAPMQEAANGGFIDLQIRWFNHWLRGIDDGIMNEPSARLYLMGAERWIDEPQWPLPTADRPLFLRSGPGGSAGSRNDGMLALEPPGQDEPDRIDHDPLEPNQTPLTAADQRSFEAQALTFTTPALEEDIEAVGHSRLVLYASSKAVDVDWCVRLCDVFPDGRSRLLNYGALKASHVASHENPQDLERDRVYCFEIEIWAMANLFKKGHRIRIDLSTSDFPSFEVNPAPSTNAVYHNATYPSHLLLPVVARE